MDETSSKLITATLPGRDGPGRQANGLRLSGLGRGARLEDAVRNQADAGHARRRDQGEHEVERREQAHRRGQRERQLGAERALRAQVVQCRLGLRAAETVLAGVRHQRAHGRLACAGGVRYAMQQRQLLGEQQ
jgi:hypothetical protein